MMQNVRATAAVTVSDFGGSTKEFRLKYGRRGHLGDLTKCIVKGLCPDRTSADRLFMQALMHRYDDPADNNLVNLSVSEILDIGFEREARTIPVGLDTL